MLEKIHTRKKGGVCLRKEERRQKERWITTGRMDGRGTMKTREKHAEGGQRKGERDRGDRITKATEGETRHNATGIAVGWYFGCDALALKCSDRSTLPLQQKPHCAQKQIDNKKDPWMECKIPILLAAGPLLFFLSSFLVTVPLLLCDLYSFSAVCFLVRRSLDSLYSLPSPSPFFSPKAQSAIKKTPRQSKCVL